MYKREDFRIYVEDILQNIRGLSGIILSTGDAVAHGTPMENLRIVTQLIAERNNI